MEDGQATLRPAQPEYEEGLKFARYLDTAADGLFSFILGKAADKVLAKAFLEPAHDLSYEHVDFAEKDTAIIGMISSYSSQQHQRSSDAPLNRAAGWRVLRMGVATALAPGLFRFLGAVSDTDFYIQAVAIDPLSRGRGVGSALIHHAEEAGRGAGCGRIALDVGVDNRGAYQLYRRLGFVEEATSPRPVVLPGTQVHRMVKEL
jgi:ribosomal protein S18 acetylase RimI-like enzyme